MYPKDYVSFGETNFIPILSYVLEANPTSYEVVDDILTATCNENFAFACLQVIRTKNLSQNSGLRTFPRIPMRQSQVPVPQLSWRQTVDLDAYRQLLLQTPNLIEDEIPDEALLFAVDNKVTEVHWNSLVKVLTQDKNLEKIRRHPLVSQLFIFCCFVVPFLVLTSNNR